MKIPKPKSRQTKMRHITGVIRGDVIPKSKNEMSNPFAQNNWGNYTQKGVVTPKDKTKAMPSPLAGKKN